MNMIEEKINALHNGDSANAMYSFTAEDLFASLREEERKLLRRHGLRLRVDKVTNDGLNALCSCYRARKPFLRARPQDNEIADLAHVALKDLNRFGIRPMISVVAKEKAGVVAMDHTDPFGTRTAIGVAGLEHVLLPVRSTVQPPQTGTRDVHRTSGIERVTAPLIKSTVR